MTAAIFSIMSMVFLAVAVAVGIVSTVTMRANRRMLDEAFGGYISCPTNRLEKDARRADRTIDQALGHHHTRSISFNDATGVH